MHFNFLELNYKLGGSLQRIYERVVKILCILNPVKYSAQNGLKSIGARDSVSSGGHSV